LYIRYLDGGKAEDTSSPCGLIPAFNNISGSIFSVVAAGEEVTFDWDSRGNEVLVDGGACDAQIIA